MFVTGYYLAQMHTGRRWTPIWCRLSGNACYDLDYNKVVGVTWWGGSLRDDRYNCRVDYNIRNIDPRRVAYLYTGNTARIRTVHLDEDEVKYLLAIGCVVCQGVAGTNNFFAHPSLERAMRLAWPM